MTYSKPSSSSSPLPLKPGKNHHDATRLVHFGESYRDHGIVNPPIYRGSTILHPSLEALESGQNQYSYGRHGTPTIRALEETICAMEGGFQTRLAPSGLAAISSVFLAFLNPGDHLLVVDTVYHCVRELCAGLLQRLNITTTYYPPSVSSDLRSWITPQTKMLWMESPGSNTMELQDLKMLCALAQEADLVSVADNTWGAGYLYHPLALGCDISVQAATKYLVGHADVLLGAVTTSEKRAKTYQDTYRQLGLCIGPDDASLCLRGLRTLDVRLERHGKNALALAQWLEGHLCVEKVLYPALPSHPHHTLWKRDFKGACGLFSVVLKPCRKEAFHAFVNSLSLFGIGYSWGGYESLILPFSWKKNDQNHSSSERDKTSFAFRLHIGLEDVNDLQNDLEKGLNCLISSLP